MVETSARNVVHEILPIFPFAFVAAHVVLEPVRRRLRTEQAGVVVAVHTHRRIIQHIVDPITVRDARWRRRYTEEFVAAV